MDVLEQMTRRYATKVTVDGQVALATNSEPVLDAAFAALGWTDPHLDSVDATEQPVAEASVVVEDIAVGAHMPEESDATDR